MAEKIAHLKTKTGDIVYPVVKDDTKCIPDTIARTADYMNNDELTRWLANQAITSPAFTGTYQKRLTAGTNITIDDSTNTISATGGGSVPDNVIFFEEVTA